MICVIHAHPYASRSRANRALLDAVRSLSDVDVRSLYDLYPDFDVDVFEEQQALARAQLIVLMHPVYWYSVPGLLKHWFDKVLTYGWAYGEGGTALRGKRCLWVPTTGGDTQSYTKRGLHAHPFSSFTTATEQTARFCGMRWEAPHIVYDADEMDARRLAEHAAALAARLQTYAAMSAADEPIKATP